jgi:hypothetical protein
VQRHHLQTCCLHRAGRCWSDVSGKTAARGRNRPAHAWTAPKGSESVGVAVALALQRNETPRYAAECSSAESSQHDMQQQVPPWPRRGASSSLISLSLNGRAEIAGALACLLALAGVLRLRHPLLTSLARRLARARGRGSPAAAAALRVQRPGGVPLADLCSGRSRSWGCCWPAIARRRSLSRPALAHRTRPAAAAAEQMQHHKPLRLVLAHPPPASHADTASASLRRRQRACSGRAEASSRERDSSAPREDRPIRLDRASGGGLKWRFFFERHGDDVSYARLRSHGERTLLQRFAACHGHGTPQTQSRAPASIVTRCLAHSYSPPSPPPPPTSSSASSPLSK